MRRRDVLKFIPGSLVLATGATAQSEIPKEDRAGGSFSIDGNKLRFYHPAVKKDFNFLMLADTHLFRDDARGEPYRQYSGRMAKAYNVTKHFVTGAPTNPEEGFVSALNIAAERQASMLALVGDLFSFPSEAAIDWVQEKLKAAGLPYIYTAGNHDWHYEGMEGSSQDLRRTWIEKRLKPMYGGKNPMMHQQDLNGVSIISIDNSDYQVQPDQLSFFQQHINSGKPTVLLLHIPLYVPGRSMGFGCGHPEWGAAADKNFELERRPRWPANGHTETTLNFHRTVFSSPNVIGILAGHTHKPSVDVLNGIPQIVTDANAVGAYLDVEVKAAG